MMLRRPRVSEAEKAIEEATKRLEATKMKEKTLHERLKKIDELRKKNGIYDAILDTFRR